jgi:hypothetical protein
MPEFELHYHLTNNGDGSASARFHQTEEEAEKADEAMDEGWGESSASSVRLKYEDGKIYFREYQRIDGKYQYVWVEIPKVE